MDISQLQQGIIAKFSLGSANECRLFFGMILSKVLK
jgi:hypothetical protein